MSIFELPIFSKTPDRKKEILESLNRGGDRNQQKENKEPDVEKITGELIDSFGKLGPKWKDEAMQKEEARCKKLSLEEIERGLSAVEKLVITSMSPSAKMLEDFLKIRKIEYQKQIERLKIAA
ncbi:MAG: hypothetical protein HYW78_02910 [Parcubacteria group bacterium]|nr:hypothetical protein [Parcubacteria group bacterium]